MMWFDRIIDGISMFYDFNMDDVSWSPILGRKKQEWSWILFVSILFGSQINSSARTPNKKQEISIIYMSKMDRIRLKIYFVKSGEHIFQYQDYKSIFGHQMINSIK